MQYHILLADDDDAILTLVSDILHENGLLVTAVHSGEEVLERISADEHYDLIILDIMMHGISGLDVCRRLRSRVDCPILFLSAMDSVKDIVAGLDLGADDYLTKPFALEELMARIMAHLRRQDRLRAARPSGPLHIGGIELDMDKMSVHLDGKPIQLSTREFELLAYLMQNAGQTLSRERIFRDVWQTEYGDIGTVAINIKNLRAKLDPDWQYIKTVWGSGYRFVTQSGLVEQR